MELLRSPAKSLPLSGWKCCSSQPFPKRLRKQSCEKNYTMQLPGMIKECWSKSWNSSAQRSGGCWGHRLLLLVHYLLRQESRPLANKGCIKGLEHLRNYVWGNRTEKWARKWSALISPKGVTNVGEAGISGAVPSQFPTQWLHRRLKLATEGMFTLSKLTDVTNLGGLLVLLLLFFFPRKYIIKYLSVFSWNLTER